MLLIIAALAFMFGSRPFNRTVMEALVMVMIVAGTYIFVGNSGVISFGHISFMYLGAWTTAWLTIPPQMKGVTLKGLPDWVLQSQLPMWVATPLAGIAAAVFALVVGLVIMRLSGIALSIATFGLLGVVNNIYSNWDSVTGGQGSIVGIPPTMNVWIAWGGAAVAILIAYLYQVSRSGLALRAARDEPVAASASGVNIVRERLIAFVVSAFVIGLAGSLYAHMLSVVTPSAFYLKMTFITLAMLVVGGWYSLTGAVAGVVVLSALIDLLRRLEKGVAARRCHARHPERRAGDRHRSYHDRHSDVLAVRPHPQPGTLLERLAVRRTCQGFLTSPDPRNPRKFNVVEAWRRPECECRNCLAP